MSVKAKRNISSILRDMLRKPQLQYGSEENALEVGLHRPMWLLLSYFCIVFREKKMLFICDTISCQKCVKF